MLQAGLIAALLFERRSRRRIAAALEESPAADEPGGRRGAAVLVGLGRGPRPDLGDHLSAGKSRIAGDTPIAFEEVLAKVHPADREELDRAVENALATGEELDVEYRVAEPDGDVRWIAARGRRRRETAGDLLGVAVDITERKLAELRAVEDRAALRHMTRVSMLGQLSASIAHQLNQPLAAILGNAEAARKMLEPRRASISPSCARSATTS